MAKNNSVANALEALPEGSSFFLENAKVGDAQYQKVMRLARKMKMRIECWWVESDEIYFRPGLRFRKVPTKTGVKSDATDIQSA